MHKTRRDIIRTSRAIFGSFLASLVIGIGLLCGQRLVQDGFEEAAAFGLGGGELRFQPVAEGHQFIDFGDDAVLFGEGWERNHQARVD